MVASFRFEPCPTCCPPVSGIDCSIACDEGTTPLTFDVTFSGLANQDCTYAADYNGVPFNCAQHPVDTCYYAFRDTVLGCYSPGYPNQRDPGVSVRLVWFDPEVPSLPNGIYVGLWRSMWNQPYYGVISFYKPYTFPIDCATLIAVDIPFLHDDTTMLDGSAATCTISVAS